MKKKKKTGEGGGRNKDNSMVPTFMRMLSVTERKIQERVRRKTIEFDFENIDLRISMR